MIINKDKLKKLRSNYKNLKIGLCHGVFDIVHNGHLNHFREARKEVDILVVSVTTDKYINKGPRQPLNSDRDRVNFLNNIKGIDYVYLNKAEDSADIISILKPDFYFKGKDYLIKDNQGNLLKEKKVLKKNGNGKIIYTQSELMSSTKLFNKNYNWTPLQKKYLKNLNKDILQNFEKAIEEVKEKKIFLIGEPIIDEYKICNIVGVTTKDSAVSLVNEKKFSIAGGVLAIAKMFSEFVKEVNLITYGDSKLLRNYFKNYRNIKIINICKKKIQTKTRYINANREDRLLQVTNFKKNFFTLSEQKIIIKKIKKNLKYDIIISDFGIGLFEDKLLEIINNKLSNKYLNVQSNSINLGFNLFTKYKNFKYLSLDKREWSIGLKSEDVTIKKIKKKLGNKFYFSITEGKLGSTFCSRNEYFHAPVFVNSVKDTTGSGDAYFTITTLLLMTSIKKNKIIPFVGNLYAGMHAQYLGNSNIISKNSLLQNLRSIVNI
jgi:cytidyltransferase-like protein